MNTATAKAALQPADSGLRVGIDLGGTKIEGVVARLGTHEVEILARLRRPTERSLGYEHVLEATAELIFAVTREAGLATPPPIGIGMPGSITRARRTVKNSNTTCLNGRPFREDLIARVGQPIAFANDANCFALAEARYGAGRGHALVFGVILGTGVGGGIVIGSGPTAPDGGPPRVWDGLQGIAGEWGHVALEPVSGPPCYCGRAGCIETLLSGPALEASYARRAGTSRSLSEIAAAAERADAHAQAVIAEACAVFGRAIATVINILDPDVIVLGGGVSHLAALYKDGVAAAGRWVFSDELVTPIRKHEIGDSAGVLGAALLPGG